MIESQYSNLTEMYNIINNNKLTHIQVNFQLRVTKFVHEYLQIYLRLPDKLNVVNFQSYLFLPLNLLFLINEKMLLFLM